MLMCKYETCLILSGAAITSFPVDVKASDWICNQCTLREIIDTERRPRLAPNPLIVGRGQIGWHQPEDPVVCKQQVRRMTTPNDKFCRGLQDTVFNKSRGMDWTSVNRHPLRCIKNMINVVHTHSLTGTQQWPSGKNCPFFSKSTMANGLTNF